MNGRKIEERVVAESVRAARGIEKHAFGLAAKYIQGLTVAGGGDHAYKSGGAIFRGNLSEFANQARVVGLVVGVISDQVRLVGGITGRVDAGSAAQRIHFEAGVVGENDFSWGISAVVFGFLAGIGFEGETVLDGGGNGSEIRQRLDRDSQRGEAAPAKSRSLPGFEVAMRTRIMVVKDCCAA